MLFADVAAFVHGDPKKSVFTYAVPEKFSYISQNKRQSSVPEEYTSEHLAIGHAVAVPYGKKEVMGIVIKIHHDQPTFETKLIKGLLYAQPVLPEYLTSTAQWMADYYHESFRSCLETVVTFRKPIAVRKKKNTLPSSVFKEVVLSDEQALICKKIVSSLNMYKTFLLHGITGSGKTEVYLDVMQKVIAAGKQVIYLVPEIALTPQTIRRVEERFPNMTSVMHSQISDGERYTVFLDCLEGNKPIVIGSRSALFAPFSRLGLIVIDEAHDYSYKQEATPHYNAVKTAQRIGEELQIPVVLGSATPRVEDYYLGVRGSGLGTSHSEMLGNPRAKNPVGELIQETEEDVRQKILDKRIDTISQNSIQIVHNIDPSQGIANRKTVQDDNVRIEHQVSSVVEWDPSRNSCALDDTTFDHERNNYELLTLTQRALNASLPVVTVVDMREELRKRNFLTLSDELQDRLKEVLRNNEQAILFLNKRGIASSLLCRQCGWTAECPRCAVALTLHREFLGGRDTLVCHHCDYQMPVIIQCPQCQSLYIKPLGSGTERVEQDIYKLFPKARVLRMDRDTTTQKGSHEKIYSAFLNHEADILIGTQMITKGWDIPNVTMVGIVNADSALHMPFYKSSEQCFSLITQVSGRAGRAAKRGTVVLQTYNPEHYAIVAAAQHDYLSFYTMEIGFRKSLLYPPFSSLVCLTLSEEKQEKVEYKSEVLFKKLNILLEEIAQDEKEYGRTELLGPSTALIPKLRNKWYYQIVLKGDKRLIDRLVQIVPNDWTIDVDPENS